MIDAAFPGSGRAWTRALTNGTQPPTLPGLGWFDPATGPVGAAPRYHRPVTQTDTMARPDTLHVSTHPAVLHKLGVLRDEKTEPKKFREVVRELSWLIGYEALQDARTRPLQIRTPMEEIEASELGERIGLELGKEGAGSEAVDGEGVFVQHRSGLRGQAGNRRCCLAPGVGEAKMQPEQA